MIRGVCGEGFKGIKRNKISNPISAAQMAESLTHCAAFHPLPLDGVEQDDKPMD
jgi:hypothetical protein